MAFLMELNVSRNKLTTLDQVRSVFGVCLECVWSVFGVCLECVQSFWSVFGVCLECVRDCKAIASVVIVTRLQSDFEVIVK
jgi:hypothetical protein